MSREIGPARERELALMIVDLSGYTALTESHGALKASETVLRFMRLAQSCLEPGVELVNSVGDEVFCAGEDTLAVVRSALKVREAVAREVEFPRVRTGVHRGSIIEREDRLFGAPINLTARLAAQAEGGQILCSEPIARAARVFADIELRSIGALRFKNVLQPVEVFELVRAIERRTTTAIDPVCRMQVMPGRAHAVEFAGRTYHLCSAECARAFASSPQLYAG